MLCERRRVYLAAAVLVAATAVAFLVDTPGARASNATPENELTALTDNARAAAGLPSFTSASDLAAVAARQAARMAARTAIYHNPDLCTDVTGWQEVGENVGVGTDPTQVHDAFMNSPKHRANILSSDFTEVGFGTAVGDDGRLYIAEVFRLPETNEAPAPAPAETTPGTAPVPVEAVDAPVPAPARVPAPTTTTPAPAPAPIRETDLANTRPKLIASFAARPPVPRTVLSHLVWVAALLAQAVLIAHMMVFWRRYRIASGW